MQYRIRNGDQIIDTIGGTRNMLPGTDDFSFAWTGNNGQITTVQITPATKAMHIVGDGGFLGFYTSYSAQTSPIPVVGKEYTISADFKGSGSAHNVKMKYESGSDGAFQVALNDTWQRLHTVCRVNRVFGQWVIYFAGGSIDAYIKHIKIEEGANSNPIWSPAPEDYGITDHSNAYRVTGLAPSTTYQLSVAPFNGLREGPKETVTVHTRGLHVTVPTQLPMNATYNLTYEEYALGLVPIGTEPKGEFGGGNRQTVPAKVIRSSSGSSVLEITNSFNLMNNDLTMKQLPDGSFAAYQGYKALFFNK